MTWLHLNLGGRRSAGHAIYYLVLISFHTILPEDSSDY